MVIRAYLYFTLTLTYEGPKKTFLVFINDALCSVQTLLLYMQWSLIKISMRLRLIMILLLQEFALIPRLGIEIDSEHLIFIPIVDKIENMVFQMDLKSSPGADGFSGTFYHACWDVIGRDIVARVQQFF